jgi:hypothetical protein
MKNKNSGDTIHNWRIGSGEWLKGVTGELGKQGMVKKQS